MDLQGIVNPGIQFLDSEMRLDMVKGLLSLIVKSASGLVEKGIKQFLIRGLRDLRMFLSRDKSLYPNNKLQSDFASAFLLKIRDLGTLTKEAKGKTIVLLYLAHLLWSNNHKIMEQVLNTNG